MNHPSPRFGSCVGAVVLGGGVLLAPGTAAAEGVHAGTAGVTLSFSLGARPAFGIGLDFRYTYLVHDPYGNYQNDRYSIGAFLQPTYLMGGALRIAGGAHGGRLFDGFFLPTGELGLGYRTTSVEGDVPGGLGLHIGFVPIFTTLGLLPVEHAPSFRGLIALDSGVNSELIIGHDIYSPGVCVFIECLGGSGRPLRTEASEAPIRAPLLLRRSRERRARLSKRIDPASRVRLFQHFARDASSECASIPAFLALARDLERAGAPDSLVARARRSAQEEAVHTGLCRGIANAFGDLDLCAMVPPMPRAADSSELGLLKRLALESFWDGCVGEAAAAAEARRRHAATKHPGVASALAVIARDEQAHADLSDRIVAFCIESGGKPVRDALMESVQKRRIAEGARLSSKRSDERAENDEELTALGLPDAAMTRSAHEEALEKSLMRLGRP